jgi:hypothetical protein
MSTEGASKRFQTRANAPFEPLLQTTGQGIDLDASLRIAHALEYIAAQLGQINEKLDHIGK